MFIGFFDSKHEPHIAELSPVASEPINVGDEVCFAGENGDEYCYYTYRDGMYYAGDYEVYDTEAQVQVHLSLFAAEMAFNWLAMSMKLREARPETT